VQTSLVHPVSDPQSPCNYAANLSVKFCTLFIFFFLMDQQQAASSKLKAISDSL